MLYISPINPIYTCHTLAPSTLFTHMSYISPINLIRTLVVYSADNKLFAALKLSYNTKLLITRARNKKWWNYLLNIWNWMNGIDLMNYWMDELLNGWIIEWMNYWINDEQTDNTNREIPSKPQPYHHKHFHKSNQYNFEKFVLIIINYCTIFLNVDKYLHWLEFHNQRKRDRRN